MGQVKESILDLIIKWSGINNMLNYHFTILRQSHVPSFPQAIFLLENYMEQMCRSWLYSTWLTVVILYYDFLLL